MTQDIQPPAPPVPPVAPGFQHLLPFLARRQGPYESLEDANRAGQDLMRRLGVPGYGVFPYGRGQFIVMVF